jgi:hypothetical protein
MPLIDQIEMVIAEAQMCYHWTLVKWIHTVSDKF